MHKASTNEPLKYTGAKQPKPYERDQNGKPIYPYISNKELVEAVNLAIYLERPLLLKGEPGCGKTKLAKAVAYELGLPYYTWNVKSSSRAKDGLYTYDAVKRLLDAQLAGSNHSKEKETAIGRLDTPNLHYVKLGALGKAFCSKKKTVVLIDEIDKADIDFPNDLLTELEERKFVIEETGTEVSAKVAPMIFITSNDEKELSTAFLRRCLFHYLKFPTYDELVNILEQRFDLHQTGELKFLQKATERFFNLRHKMEKQNLFKKISTSELIDWVDVILKHNELDKRLKIIEGKLPYPQVLLKHWDETINYLIEP